MFFPLEEYGLLLGENIEKKKPYSMNISVLTQKNTLFL